MTLRNVLLLNILVIYYDRCSLAMSRIVNIVSEVHTYIHILFCYKLSITEYKYYVDSNGRLPVKLVLIVLAAHY